MDSLVCAIYNAISAEATEYKPEHGWADISALEDAEQLDKVSNNEMILFTLLFIIQVSGLRVSAAGAEGEVYTEPQNLAQCPGFSCQS